LTNCIITAPAEGMVIFPSAAEWKETPDIEEGARVREQQTLLMIPDTSKMQVKVGVHESKVGRLRIGMTAKVALQDLELTGKVDEIAEVTRPAGWWTGNMVKYDTMIRLDPQPGLKPGMSAVVDIVLASYTDVVKVPVAAIVQSTDGYLCWIRKDGQIERRNVTLGDTNDEYIIVQSGLAEGEEVVLNPLAHLKQAEKEALKPGNSSRARSTSPQKSPEKTADKVKTAKDKRDSAETPTKKSIDTESQTLLKAGDKNGDGFLQKDELAAKDQANFAKIDANKDNKISISELSTALKAAKGK
ncbi:HlyD family efflux transporter periplasmic adaptor subunit, partial [Rubripirellula sp.]